MARLLCMVWILVCSAALLDGRASEYQLETEALSRCEILRSVAVGTKQEEVPHCLEDGSFRSVQCSGQSQECWCVDSEGQEVTGTRTNNSIPHCPTPCQLQSLLQCAPSGLFEPVQCDSRGRCWCVDQDGMELYGTRQASIPRRCPSSCEVRSRRLLHSSASSPPQCAADGSFLPVQCKFINTTDRTELDLLLAFSSSPEAFETFRNFRKFFPLVSSYCFCSDSRGRELQGTGVELLMSEVYDSAFSGPRSAHSFAQTNIYRVLQRRMLGVRLALSGHFRCPSPCEEERRAALESSSVFVPSCEADGRFSAKQCQQGALCWCVDPTGRELTGTRRPGDGLVCGSGPADCPAQRRLALSQLFSGLVRPPQASSGSATLCLSLLRPLRVLGYSDPTSFLSRLVEVLQGLFPSVGGALEALTRSPAQRLQENLFGGKFLQNVAAFNYTGVLGPRGAVGVDQLSAQSLQENRDLVRAVSRALEDPAFLSALRQTLMVLSGAPSGSLQQVLAGVLRSCSEEEDDSSSLFVPRCSLSGGYQPVQCRDAECWCVNLQGQEAPGSRTAGWPPRCPTSCEMARANAMKVKSNMAAGAEIHIPACSEDGDFLPLQCVGDRCFCVDAEGRKMAAGPTGGAVTCPENKTLKLQSGRCSKALAEVTAFRQEVDSLVFLSNSTHLPVGYGFLLAKGLSLSQSEEELQLSQSEELKVSERLLSRSRSALRLAASSTLLMLLPPHRLSYQLFTPQCDAAGNWRLTQCYHSTGQCWCVDEEGEFIPGSLRRSLRLPRCRSRCQRAEAHSLLSDWMKASDITTASPYHPQCEQDGRFSVLQTGGAAGWCVNPLTGETLQTASRSAAGELTCPSWCELQRLRCRPDGSFDPLQCDVTSCWCVSEDGQEMAGTRSLRQTGRTPSCDRPLCPAPNITHGALVCHPAADGRQSCDLVCHHGYQNSLPVSSFLCSIKSRQWDEGDKPLSGACQISQPLQSLSSSQIWSLSVSCSRISGLSSLLFSLVASRGLCSAQLPSGRSVALCGDSAVGLWCDAGDSVRLTLRWTADLSDLTTSDLPHLHHMVIFLNESRLLEGVQGILGNLRSMLTSDPELVSVAPPTFGCSHGYRLSSDGAGCVVCPAGSFYQQGVCLLCPQGTYQELEGRDFCTRCPRGSSPAGASAANQCETDCERRGLRCSQSGDFLLAQPNFLSGGWRCVSNEGVELEWTSREERLTDEECSVLTRFQAVPESDLMVGAGDQDQNQTRTKPGPGPNQDPTRTRDQNQTRTKPGPNQDQDQTRTRTKPGPNQDQTSTRTKPGPNQDQDQTRTRTKPGPNQNQDQFGPGSGLGCERPVFVSACAVEPSCHHVALFDRRTRCDLYSSLNAVCSASQQATGFLGNPRAERFHQLRCSLRVRGGASDLFVLRKNGAELQHQSFVRMRMRKAVSGVFRTQVFSSRNTSLSDVRRFCQDGCSRDACCHGFILNQNVLDGGSLLCGWLRAPSVLMCEDEDWDVIGQGPANRICGAGLSYSKQQRSFEFDFGGEKFTITDSALPGDSRNRKDYQAAIISFQAIYLNTAAAAGGSGSASCGAAEVPAPLNATVQLRFQSLSSAEVLVDPQRKQPVLSFWLSKNDYSSQNALLWCLTRCDEEEWCSVTDLGESESDRFFRCALYPDTRVCGGYDQPIRRSCRPLLDRATNNTYSKKVDLSGPVQSFYERVPFQKMVSYSVRNRVTLGQNQLLPDGFRECERRCDEDPCCRGFGFVHETKSRGLLCLPLISLGVLTCSEDDASTWRTQDCSPPEAETSPEPFGWYQKPVNQWTTSPALCPPFSLRNPRNNVFMDDWRLLSESSLLIDASLSTYDVIHVSRDIDTDRERTRDWCLHACQEAESCVAVSLRKVESAVRCILYPDTTTCGLSSAPDSLSPASSCRLVVKEPAPQVYLRAERSPQAASISVPGHGTLQGVAMETAVGSDRRTVIRFLGVPYARPPIGVLRFEAAQLADWTGTWDATKPRPSCVQPGDDEDSASSEDCLYLNIFTPAVQRGRVPVLVYFFNPPANQNQNLLDGSALAALGNIVVVTASYRTAALGFLTAGGLHGNYGLSDQEAALRWVHAHISLVGGDSGSVTVGAERRGADISSLTLLSSSPPFHRMILMGGSVFSPSLVQTASAGRRQAVDLARELGCVTSDLSDDGPMVACLRSTPVHKLNAAQTKLLAVSGPFQAWAPVRRSESESFHRVDLMLGTSEHDGLISRARRIKDFEALQGRGDRKTAFYEALSRSLGGASGNALLKDAAAWFYSLDHDPSAAGYNLFSRALNNATRDLFIICPTVQMALHWAASGTNIFQYHQPASSAQDRADVLVPLDVQFLFGIPLQPMNSQRFTSSDRRLSLAVMTYASSFIRTGNPNPSHVWAESVLPRWQPVTAEAPPTYLELSPALQHQQGLRQNACSFWRELGTRLTSKTGDLGAEPVQIPELPLAAPSSQSQTNKDAYN
ncbi:thyroglobulin [Poecilia latipinna]|uniref:thyroglobulin n=1 Tax=Poecilia latipinna TaxID=48699 RepID=UPI00072DCE9D|nr:PREDICTED: thyroglobulin [Poecilia latipinna]